MLECTTCGFQGWRYLCVGGAEMKINKREKSIYPGQINIRNKQGIIILCKKDIHKMALELL